MHSEDHLLRLPVEIIESELDPGLLQLIYEIQVTSLESELDPGLLQLIYEIRVTSLESELDPGLLQLIYEIRVTSLESELDPGLLQLIYEIRVTSLESELDPGLLQLIYEIQVTSLEWNRSEAGTPHITSERLHHSAKEPCSSAFMVLELLTSSHPTDRTESGSASHSTACYNGTDCCVNKKTNPPTLFTEHNT
ncbi:UNVERIFIED_CONTAM: hypothetical protein FKN15_007772 [Acipenser sinensis]